jgi:energy-coupling factor transport system permease protein
MIELYAPGDSWLHRLDPRVKLAGALLGVFACFALPSLPAQIVLLLAAAAILWSALRNMERMKRIFGALLPVDALLLLLQPWFAASGRVLWEWGPLQLTVGGLESAALLIIRVNALALVAAIPLLTTPHERFVRALMRLGMPYTWGLTVSLAVRSIPALMGLYGSVREAQEARGWTSGRGGILSRARGLIPVLVATVVAAIRMSDRLAMSMAVRGLGHGPRTTLHELAMRRADWVALGLIALGFGTVIVLA